MSDIKAAVIGGLIAAISSAAGSAGTAYISYMNGSQQAEQANRALALANSKISLDQFIEKTAPVTLALNSLLNEGRLERYDRTRLISRSTELTLAVSAMMPYVSIGLYNAADKAASALHDMIQADNENSLNDRSAAAKEAVSRFISAYYEERNAKQVKLDSVVK